jgi:phosphotransferase system enzyme I (PtsI)
LTQAKTEKLFYGNGVSAGVVQGHVLKLDSHNRVLLKVLIPEDSGIEEEVKRFRLALESSRDQLLALRSSLAEIIGGEHSFILDAHLLMLEDKTLIAEIESCIRAHRANAEWAVRQATDRLIRAYESLDDEYFRERSSDIENVVERILLNLAGERPFNWRSLPEDSIVVSHDFNPSSFAVMDLRQIRGLALESGGRTSHTAIIARSLRLPAVMEIRDLLSSVESGDRVLLNGDEGQVIVNPSPDRLFAVRGRMEESKASVEPAASLAGSSTVTRDGTRVALCANTELPYEGKLARKCGAEGIGLFRSEFVYFSHVHGSPRMEEQLEIYRNLAVEMFPFPVSVRTLDGATQEILGELPAGCQSNPSMGLRGIRLSLLAQKVFRAQVEAILRASVAGNMEIVLPMVSALEEIRAAKRIIESVRNEIAGTGYQSLPPVPLGVMIEVPAAVMTLEAFAEEVDFFCVGTNDLIQYMLAVDRDNPLVAHLFQPLHPSILQCLKRVADVTNRLGKSVRICGEISANPFFAVLLLGMGFTQLSMNALSIGTIRNVLSEITAESARKLLEKVMVLNTAEEVADLLVRQVSGSVSMDLRPFVKEIKTPPHPAVIGHAT